MDTEKTILVSRGVRLREIRESDIDRFVHWRNDPNSLMMWSTNRHILDRASAINEFWQQLHGDKHIMLVAEDCDDKVVGAIYSYGAQFVDQHCFVTVYVEDEYRHLGYGPVMMALFINYLFTYFSFRKVYLEAYDYNGESRSPIERFGFELEGTFCEHRYFDGKWHSLKRYALFRKDLGRVRSFLSRRAHRQLP